MTRPVTTSSESDQENQESVQEDHVMQSPVNPSNQDLAKEIADLRQIIMDLKSHLSKESCVSQESQERSLQQGIRDERLNPNKAQLVHDTSSHQTPQVHHDRHTNASEIYTDEDNGTIHVVLSKDIRHLLTQIQVPINSELMLKNIHNLAMWKESLLRGRYLDQQLQTYLARAMTPAEDILKLI